MFYYHSLVASLQKQAENENVRELLLVWIRWWYYKLDHVPFRNAMSVGMNDGFEVYIIADQMAQV